MQELTLDILPKEGYGEVKFGDCLDKLIEYIGEPEDVENLNDEDEFPTVVLHYFDKKITVFLEGLKKQVISCFEVEDNKSTLFGKWIFLLKEAELIKLMQDQGYEELDSEMEEWGEKRISFEDALIDFYFDKEGKLISVNWGVLVNDEGQIEEF